MRTKSIEKTIEDLKSQHDRYAAETERAKEELAAVQARVNKFQTLTEQTQDALDALYGRPTLKKTLEAALAQQASMKQAPLPSEIGAALAPVESVYTPKDQPPAEPGFKWIRVTDPDTQMEEDVLVSIEGYKSDVAVPKGATIILPTVTEDSDFEAPTLDI